MYKTQYFQRHIGVCVCVLCINDGGHGSCFYCCCPRHEHVDDDTNAVTQEDKCAVKFARAQSRKIDR